ncbi:MAG: transmembrane protein 268 [Actinomycetota bacterium]|nr:transmembrane protein 268 [Actinomycetota bacterium]
MKRPSLAVRVGGAIAAGAAVVALVPLLPAVGRQSPPVGQQSPPRVTVCHKPGTPAQKTMTLPQPAVQAHLGHGDIPGPCPGR